MIAHIPPCRLFVYGTLRDDELFEIVAGRPLSRFAPVLARGVNTLALSAMEEPMPLLIRSSSFTQGLLLRRVDDEAWRRIRFYEDDIYRCAPIHLHLASGNEIGAHAFWPRRGTPKKFRRWNFRDWQRISKRRAIAVAKRFMEYSNAPVGTDLAGAWRDIQASLGA